MKQKWINIIILVLMWPIYLHAADKTSFSDSQKSDLHQLFHNYLLENPEVLVEASRALHRKQQEQMLARAQAAIPEHADELFNAKSPSIGKDKAPIYVVAFLDYLCGHCKGMTPIIDKVLKNHDNVQVIFKDFPIFGDSSRFAAKAALAADLQGKYYAMHKGLMAAKAPLDKDKVMSVAKAAGIDTVRLSKDMENESLDKALMDNMALAQGLNIMGTPAFVVASHVGDEKAMKTFFVPGAATYQMLANLIKQAAAKG